MVVPIPTDVIDDHVDDEREAIYLYLSENNDTSTHKKTDEERLGQMITYLRVAFDRDVQRNKKKASKYEEHCRGIKVNKFRVLGGFWVQF